MKLKNFLSLFICFALLSSAHAQSIKLTFTGKSGIQYAVLDSILVQNLSYFVDTMLYYPDTVITLGGVGIEEYYEKDELSLANYPNPFDEQTIIAVNIPGNDYLDLAVYNIMGERVSLFGDRLPKGVHEFIFYAGSENIYFVRAKFGNELRALKMINVSSGMGKSCRLDHIGLSSANSFTSLLKASKGFVYNFGDELGFIGFSNGLQNSMIDVPTSDKIYTFQFTTASPCDGLSYFVYDNQVYTTVEIGTQCWMAENLNAGKMILPVNDQSDNGEIEKYCYNNDTNQCLMYGGLYQWNEAMQYLNIQGTQGVCPAGWHVPTDNEWKILEGNVDGLYGVGDPEWDGTVWRGSYAGHNLKSTYGWYNNINGADLYGFTALPGGSYSYVNYFNYQVSDGYFWTSSEYDTEKAWSRRYNFAYDGSGRYDFKKIGGQSIRCLKNCQPLPTKANAGPDTLNIPVDSLMLMGNTPVIGQGLWTIFSGTGGYFYDATDPTTIFHGFPGNMYLLVWTISNNCGSSSDTVRISFYSSVFNCGNVLVDPRDGKYYGTVLIGNQCWMAENLNVGEMILPTTDQSDNGILEKYCYNNDTNQCNIYGGLYQWGEVMQYTYMQGVHGICPPGWHVPTDAEFKILEGNVDSQFGVGDPEWDGTVWRGYDAGYNLKSTYGWYNNINGADLYGFTVLPGGSYSYVNYFNYQVSDGYFWTSSEYDTIRAWSRRYNFAYDGSGRYDFKKIGGQSIRCLQDCQPLPTQADAGPDSLNIVGDSIMLMANTPLIGQGLWTIYSGAGGYFIDDTDPNTLFYGQPGTTYHLLWTISNGCGSSSDTVMISFFGSSFNCGDTLVDPRDGKNYGTVLIGNQCWMAENLNVGVMILPPSDQNNNGILERYCYNNDTNQCNIYGGLYQWDEVMQYTTIAGTQGICPVGWHVPTDAEFKILEGNVDSQYGVGDSEWDGTVWRGYDAGYNLKSSYGWYNNINGADLYGFTVLPGGSYSNVNNFNYKISDGYFWTSSEYDADEAWSRRYNFAYDGSGRYDFKKISAQSLRCVKN